MGNGFSFIWRSRAVEGRRSTVEPWPSDDATDGHSFRYLQSSSSLPHLSSAPSSPSSSRRRNSLQRVAFRSISGASVSGNSSSRPIRSLTSVEWDDSAAPPAKFNTPGFEGSCSFPAAPLRLASPLSTPVSPPGDYGRGRKKRTEGFSFLRDFPLLRRASLFLQRRSKRFRTSWIPQESLLQWAHGKAGEDRVHVVVSEEQRWLFVGIYDGFNGSEASEFLVANLYKEIFKQLEILCRQNAQELQDSERFSFLQSSIIERPLQESQAEIKDDSAPRASYSIYNSFTFLSRSLKNRIANWRKQSDRVDFLQGRKIKERKYKEKRGSSSQRRGKTWRPSHVIVLEALSRALEITESEYFWMMSMELSQKPQLALSGSCVLVLLTIDDNAYIMNLGDSRAIIAQQRSNPSKNWTDASSSDEEIVEEIPPELVSFQLSTDHNTNIEEEVRRIREEHPDDGNCIVNNKVKGRLRVTRAFGAGYLKEPRWNEGLLRAFRSDYVGTEAYISSSPWLHHHRFSQSDKFLVLSSDGLYQYLTNQEVVSHVKIFMENFPDGDPAQSLINEFLIRAADEIGMDFHELLTVPPGDRRNYHDDVTVVIVSLEGRTHVDRGFGGGAAAAAAAASGGSLRRVRERGLSWSAREGEGEERESGEDLAVAAAAQGKERRRRRGRGGKEVGLGEGKGEDAAIAARGDTR